MTTPKPELPEEILRAHEDALARREDGYIDPTTGLFVMTSAYLLAQGTCCGSGCRHCPYEGDEKN